MMEKVKGLIDDTFDDMMKKGKVQNRSTISKNDKFNVMMNNKETLLNYAEYLLLNKFERKRKKEVLDINKKIHHKVNYNSKLAFLQLSLGKDMTYYSKTLKSY